MNLVRHFVLENFWWKAASLGLSFALWFSIINEPELVTNASVPIFYRGLQRGLEIASDQPERIFLEIRGPASRLSPSSLADTAAQIDLTDVTNPGQRTFTISRTNINLPSGVNFLRAVPSQLRLSFDNQFSKDVAVHVRVAGQPAEGYRVAGEGVEPERLRIVGPASRVRLIEFAETDPVDVTHADRTFSARVHTFISDSQVRFESSPMVKVQVNIEATNNNK